MPSLVRYQTDENRKLAETVFFLRLSGLTYQEVARRTGLTLQNARQMEHRERAFRCEAFQYPLIEYIATRTEKIIRRSLGEEMLSKPDELSAFQNISELISWPGVSDGVMKDLADGLAEAGYESFDVEDMKDALFVIRRQAQKMRQQRFRAVEH